MRNSTTLTYTVSNKLVCLVVRYQPTLRRIRMLLLYKLLEQTPTCPADSAGSLRQITQRKRETRDSWHICSICC